MNLIVAVNQTIVVRRTENIFEMNGYEIYASCSAGSSLEEWLLGRRRINLLDVALNLLTPYRDYVHE